MGRVAVLVLVGFALGSVPFGLLLTRAAGLPDLRSIGSGSIGATNVLRTGRQGLAAATLLLDGLKGAVAVLLARGLAGDDAGLLAGIAAILGHLFPPWLGWRGGKGVATGLGVLFAACWLAGIGTGLVWLAAVLLSRISSAGALCAFAAAPALAWLFCDGKTGGAVLVIACLVFLRHEANIRRLMAGTEPRVGARLPR